MLRITSCTLFSICLLACGPRIKPVVDAGEEIDAGMEVDAGRVRGEDPPSGWQMAVELPAGAAPSTKLGIAVAAIGDQFSQPLIAALYEDPNGDLNYDDNRIVYTRWDGVAKAFEPLKTIEVVGGGASVPSSDRQISIARDAETGRIGIAYVKPQDNTVRLAVSDDEGVNFSLSTISDVPRAALMANPSLALQGGATHLGWIQGSDIMYRKRVGAGAFMDVTPGALVSGGRSLSLAVDSAGNAGLAFFVSVAGTSADLAFWRPGSAANAIASADMLDLTVTGRDPSVALTFVGTTPHLAYHLRKLADVDATELWYLKATDTGSTWSTPIAIPRNSSAQGAHSTRYHQALAIEPSGRVSVAAPWSLSGTQTNCIGPKLSRAPDGVTFTTCSPMGSPIQRGGEWINLWTHRPGKQTLVFHYDSRANPSIKAGIVLWREP